MVVGGLGPFGLKADMKSASNNVTWGVMVVVVVMVVVGLVEFVVLLLVVVVAMVKVGVVVLVVFVVIVAVVVVVGIANTHCVPVHECALSKLALCVCVSFRFLAG